MSLEIKNLCKDFGGIRAVQDFNMALEPARVTALIGPNGAGKTTAFDMITGFLRPSAGRITWKNKYITNNPPFRIAQLGISRTFQEVKLFRSLTVGENLLIAKRKREHEGLVSGLINRNAVKKMTHRHLEEISTYLKQLQLEKKIDTPALSLSYGQSKLVEILRATLSDPCLLMLDEPVAGLSPPMISTLKQFIGALVKEKKTTLFLIEHNIPFVFEIADHVIVIDHGAKIAEGPPEMILNDPNVIRAYLG